MTKQEIKTRIKRHIKRGTYKTVNVSKFNIKATARAFEQSWCYYTELKEDSLLAYNTLTNQLTLYLARG